MTTVDTRRQERAITKFLHEIGRDVFRLSQRTIPVKDEEIKNQIFQAGKLTLSKDGFDITYGEAAIGIDAPSEFVPSSLKPVTVRSRRSYRRASNVRVTSPRYTNVTSFTRKGGYVRAHDKTWRIGTRPVQNPTTGEWYTDTKMENFGYRMAAVKAKNNWVMEASNKIINRLSPAELEILIDSGALPRLIDSTEK